MNSKLAAIGTVGQRNTGTTVRFWPDPKFFDSDKFSLPQLRHMLKAKAYCAPDCASPSPTEATGEKDEWFYSGDLGAYLMEELESTERPPGRAHHRRTRERGRCLSAMLCCGRPTFLRCLAKAM